MSQATTHMARFLAALLCSRAHLWETPTGDTAIQVCPRLPHSLLGLDQARPAQSDLRGLLSAEGLFIRVSATDRGSKAEKRMMISPRNGVLQRTASR